MSSRRQFLKLMLGSSTAIVASGCTVSEVRRSISAARHLHNGNVSRAVTSQIPGTGIPEFDGVVRKGLAQMLDDIAEYWEDGKTASPQAYVKYSDNYQSRAIIDFSSGLIQIETIRADKESLKKAIVQTLLTPNDPSLVDLYSAKPPQIGSKPFLFELVRDQDGQAIRYSWRANRFADYLLKKHYQTFSDQGKTRQQIQFYMVDGFKDKQRLQYQFHVFKQSKRFNIDPALIYSIIETESSFNPYAVSHAPAYGLMQIVPTTAGRDVFRLLENRDGIPSKQMLFNPAINIEYGAAYLSILNNNYLRAIRDPKSKEFCIIAAYNTGAGNVLAAFAKNRSAAISKINRMSSSQVYQHLKTRLSSSEARNYIVKVNRNKAKYRHLA